jgi:hypothetical protein
LAVLPTRKTRLGAVLTSNPSIGSFAALIPAWRDSGQSPMMITGLSAAGGSFTTGSSARVLSWTDSTSSATIVLRVWEGAG